jgi:hypothetical protein
MSALAAELGAALEIPRLYLACPLTGLAPEARQFVSSEVAGVKAVIERHTVTDRVEGEAWPLAVYAPLDKTAPWRQDGLAPGTIYERNLTHVLDSDAMVVVGRDGLSAGVGQEIAWATTAGLPILCLTPGQVLSRQIAGTPGRLEAATFGDDWETRDARLANWLRANRALIADGPRRRHNRRLRYQATTSRLRNAWQSASDRTGVAARCGMTFTTIESVLSDPARVALMPNEWLAALSTELRVPRPSSGPQLGIRALRAWFAYIEQEGLDDTAAERLRILGTVSLTQTPGLDLDTADGWRALLADLSE